MTRGIVSERKLMDRRSRKQKGRSRKERPSGLIQVQSWRQNARKQTNKGSTISHLGSAESAALCSETSAAFDFAWLLIELTAAHFFLNAATFNKLTETTHGVLDRLFFTKSKFDHCKTSNERTSKRKPKTAK